MNNKDLKLEYLREIALEILEISRDPILLSGHVDYAKFSELAVKQIISTLNDTVAPLFFYPRKDERELIYAIDAIRRARALRRLEANKPMMIHRGLIVEEV